MNLPENKVCSKELFHNSGIAKIKMLILPTKVLADILFTPGDDLGCCCFNLSSVLGNETELHILIFRVSDSTQKGKDF
jgi:hypothetical protein